MSTRMVRSDTILSWAGLLLSVAFLVVLTVGA